MSEPYVSIIPDTDPILRAVSSPVTIPLNQEDQQLLQSLYRYVKDSHDEEKREQHGLKPAVGLAAIQTGVKKRMLAVCVEEEDEEGNQEVFALALANPKLLSHSEQKSYLKSGEGCLSVLDEHPGYALRHARIRISGYDLLTNKQVNLRLSGYHAIVLQHELDHLDGILFYDRIDKEDPYRQVADAIEIQ
ncbi:MAG: peptide deformylase [Erysipelotrichaceae bacterium]|jgi:peptide deformylase|nr:peptide deformylase [Erysipelotrichaceae bacterium]